MKTGCSWMDVDLDSYPPTVLNNSLASGKSIVHPTAW